MSHTRPQRNLCHQSARALGLACALFLAGTNASAAKEQGFPPWAKLADVDVIDIVTTDDDGDLRETPVWFVMVEGAPYLRTNDSTWLENILRGSDVLVRIEGLEYDVDAEVASVASGNNIVEKVDAASLEKYGWQERLLFMRLSPPDILKIVPRR